jgi:hypothetical protein
MTEGQLTWERGLPLIVPTSGRRKLLPLQKIVKI